MFGLAVLKITISKNIYNLKRFILYLPLTFWILSALGVMKSDQIILILLLMHVIDLHRLFPPRKYDEYYYSQICLSSGSNLILLLIFSIAKKFLFSS